MRARATEWVERVRAWRESGQSAEEFAAGKDFTERTLMWWAGEFDRRSRSKGAVKLARVVGRAERDESVALSESVMLSVAGVSICVRLGFDAELLRQVIRALGDAR
jgi:hypothetical protein